MNWKRYRVFFKVRDWPFDRARDYFVKEALSSGDAIRMAKAAYSSRVECNPQPLKDVKFSAVRWPY